MNESVTCRHDAELHVVITCGLSSHGEPCDDSIIPAYELEAHLTLMAVMHGKVSGYDSGVRVQWAYEFVNPERDVLADGEPCTCKECLVAAQV